MTQDITSPSGYGRYFPLARELHKLGHHVEIAGLHAQVSTQKPRFVELDGVKIHHVAPMHVRKTQFLKSYYPGWKLTLLSIQASIALTWSSLRIKPDIIHICKPHPMNCIAGLVSRFLKGRTLVMDLDDYEEAIGRFGSSYQRAIVSLFERNMPGRVRLITTNTRFNEKRLIASGISPKKIIYLPSGVDKDRFTLTNDETAKQIIQVLNLQGKKIIAYIGSISRPSHGVDLLLPTLRKVLQTDPSAVLLAVGAGDALPDLVACAKAMNIEDHVRFVGWVSPDIIPQYYAIADVSIDPVMKDDAARGRFPLKLLESWASGIPFITGDVGDRKELMGIPTAGILVEPGNPESLAEGVLKIITDSTFAAKIKNIGYIRAGEFNWEDIAGDLESIYMRIK